MSRLTSDQVALQLENLPGWQADGNSLVRTYEFSDFASTIAFIMHVAFYCEELEHYPTWHNYLNILTVRIGDPNQADIHGRDVQLARRMEAAYTER